MKSACSIGVIDAGGLAMDTRSLLWRPASCRPVVSAQTPLPGLIDRRVSVLDCASPLALSCSLGSPPQQKVPAPVNGRKADHAKRKGKAQLEQQRTEAR